jgi:hypothetical protein
MKKCSHCFNKITGKLYKRGKKYFCSKKHKYLFFDNHIPTLLDKIQIEFNKLIIEDKSCSVCGKKFNKMQCSHTLSVGDYPSIRFDILNALPMCGHCHNFWWHLNPIDAYEWFAANYPDRLKYLKFAREQNKPWTVEELHRVRQAIQEKEISKLIRFGEEFVACQY